MKTATGLYRREEDALFKPLSLQARKLVFRVSLRRGCVCYVACRVP